MKHAAESVVFSRRIPINMVSVRANLKKLPHGNVGTVLIKDSAALAVDCKSQWYAAPRERRRQLFEIFDQAHATHCIDLRRVDLVEDVDFDPALRLF